MSLLITFFLNYYSCFPFSVLNKLWFSQKHFRFTLSQAPWPALWNIAWCSRSIAWRRDYKAYALVRKRSVLRLCIHYGTLFGGEYFMINLVFSLWWVQGWVGRGTLRFRCCHTNSEFLPLECVIRRFDGLDISLLWYRIGEKVDWTIGRNLVA